MPTREEMIKFLDEKKSVNPDREKMISFLEGRDKPTTMFSEASMAPVINERTPHITISDRLLFKNFGGSIEEQRDALQKKYPKLNVEIIDKEIAVKKPEEKQYKKLDPSGFDPEDISDIGYDIASGFGSGAATVGGATVGGPVGAIAAGGLASGGLEALRQKIGQYAGVHGDINKEDLAWATGLGAAAPLAFGAKAGGKEVIKGAVPWAAEKVGKGLKYLGGKMPKMLSKTTALDEDAITGYMKHGEEGLKKLDTSEKMNAFGNQTNDEILSKLKTAKDDAAEIIKIEEDGVLQDITPAQQFWKDEIDMLDQEIASGGANRYLIDKKKQAEYVYKKLFTAPTEPLKNEKGEIIKQADTILTGMQPAANVQNRVIGGLRSLEEKKLDPDILAKLKHTYDVVNEETPEALRAARANYGEILDTESAYKSFFLDTGKKGTYSNKPVVQMMKGLTTSDVGHQTLIKDITQKTGVDLGDRILQLKSAQTFGKIPSKYRKSFTNMPMAYLGAGAGGLIGRKIAGGAGNIIGMTLGGVTGAALSSPAIVKRYAQGIPLIGKGIIEPLEYGVKATGRTLQKFPNVYPQVLMNISREPKKRKSGYDNLGQ